MGMCKGCQIVFNTNDMENGYCKTCINSGKSVEIKTKEETRPSSKVLTIIISLIIASVVFFIVGISLDKGTRLHNDSFMITASISFFITYLLSYFKIYYEVSFFEALEKTEQFIRRFKYIFFLIVSSLLISYMMSINEILYYIYKTTY